MRICTEIVQIVVKICVAFSKLEVSENLAVIHNVQAIDHINVQLRESRNINKEEQKMVRENLLGKDQQILHQNEQIVLSRNNIIYICGSNFFMLWMINNSRIQHIKTHETSDAFAPRALVK
jgi:hypothetical protein